MNTNFRSFKKRSKMTSIRCKTILLRGIDSFSHVCGIFVSFITLFDVVFLLWIFFVRFRFAMSVPRSLVITCLEG